MCLFCPKNSLNRQLSGFWNRATVILPLLMNFLLAQTFFMLFETTHDDSCFLLFSLPLSQKQTQSRFSWCLSMILVLLNHCTSFHCPHVAPAMLPRLSRMIKRTAFLTFGEIWAKLLLILKTVNLNNPCYALIKLLWERRILWGWFRILNPKIKRDNRLVPPGVIVIL